MFVVQTDKFGIPVNDMCTELINSCKYQNWFYDDNAKTVLLRRFDEKIVTLKDLFWGKYDHDSRLITGKIKNEQYIVPIGNIEFVEKYLGKHIKPINIPDCLTDEYFTKRFCKRMDYKELQKALLSSSYFVKSDETLKDFSDIYKEIGYIKKIDKYFVSEPVLFTDEWRAFIYKNKILDVRKYLGDWDKPDFDIQWLKNAVSKYSKSESCPKAYTLDFGYFDGKIAIIECHRDISIGLYGFEDYKKIPNMFYSSYMEEMSITHDTKESGLAKA